MVLLLMVEILGFLSGSVAIGAALHSWLGGGADGAHLKPALN